MTQEEITIIRQIKNNNLKQSYDLLIANRSFLCGLYSKLYVQGYYLDEFMSMAYEALLKAAKQADLEKVEYFRGYWKKFILHEYLLEKLRVKYNFSLSVYDYSIGKRQEIDYISSFRHRYTSCISREGLVSETLENSELRKALWCEIRDTLTKENAYILWEIYYNNRNMSSLARELGIGAERVRRRKLRSLEKLKSNRNIQNLARDYYAISV